MVRNEISQKVGQQVQVHAQVSVPWDGKRVAWCIQKIEIDNEVAVDHSWIQIRDNPELNQIARNSNHGDWIEFVGIIGSYTKKGGAVDYNIQSGHQ